MPAVVYRGVCVKNLAVVFAASITDNCVEQLDGDKSALDMVLQFAENLPDTDSIVLLCGEGFPVSSYPDIDTIHDERWTVSKLTNWLARLSEGFDHVFYMYGDTPFLDNDKADEMYSNHLKYAAQYSFADGYPIGVAPEIIESGTLKLIDGLAAGNETPVERDSIFEVLKKDINAFDIETDIAAIDQRLLRVTLSADTNRNTLLLRRMIDDDVRDLENITLFLSRKPEQLRTLPAFVNIQIEDGCPQACSYCPWPVVRGDVKAERAQMEVEKFRSVLEKVAGFAGDATVGISLWGEPSLHDSVEEIAGAVACFEGLSLLIETSGIGWRSGALDRILETVGDRTEWIVSLDALDADLYSQLRGEGMKEAVDTARYLLQRAGRAAHIQAVRMKENEGELQEFYKFWKAHTDNIIVQKYDFVSGLLPQRKVTDLSPLKRFPCWHLKRDLSILLDGSVPLCREDIKHEHALGNIFTDPLEEIWKKGEEWYLKHTQGEYPGLCRECDEYYTYNF